MKNDTLNSAEITALIAVIGTVFSFLGLTIDPALLQSGILGLVSFVTLLTTIWSWWIHHKNTATTIAAGKVK